MDSPALPATSILSGATIQTAERNEFNNTGGNMTKIIVQNFTIDPGSTQAGAEVISDTSSDSEGCENQVSDTVHSSLDIYSFVSFFLSLIFARTAPSPSGAEETTCLYEPPVIVSEIPLDDPLALPIPEASCSPSHRYTRSMLEKGIGYPLYEPQPDCEPSSEYWGKGVRVGDVGIVTADGIFDFLFNVCPSQNPSINPPTIPEDFIEELDCQVRVVEHLQPNACLFSSGVNRSQDQGGSYTCLGPNGAILELPVGATRFEAKDKLPLKRLATRDAEKWYRYTILNMGRDAQNGSLYLVTTCIKCTDWGIAVFERPSAPDCLRFIIDEGLAEQNHPKYSWEGLGAFITRVTPNPNNLGSNDGDILNQCVFLRGYKIELRKDIWDNLESPQSTTKSYTTTSQFANKGNKSTRKGNPGNQNDCSRSETGFGPRLTFGTTNLAQDVIEYGAIAFTAESERVTVHADFSSSPVHPSDLINAALLSQRPDAKVALTHDDDWCDMMQGHEDLSKIALSYTSMLDEFGCVSLERTGQLTEKQSKSIRSFKADHELKTHSCSHTVQVNSSYQIRNQGINEPPVVEVSGNPYIEGIGGGSLFTDEELARDLGLRSSINLNDTLPSSTVSSIQFPPSQASSHLTSHSRISRSPHLFGSQKPRQPYGTKGVNLPASSFINTPDSGYGGSAPLMTSGSMVKPQQSLAYLDHYSQQHRESETHGITSSTSTSTGTARTSAVNLTTNPQSGASNPSLNPTDLRKGIPLHSVPSSCPLCIVEFKAGRTDLYYLSDQKMDVRVGDWIIVEADRGRDLGKVVSEGITTREVELWQSREVAKAQAQQEINPKMIYAKAGPQDIETLAAKLGDERKALQLCQTKVRAKRLPIEVVDAEYQWDRRKLTFYFVGEKNIDFRELVRELFRLYKTRIWMASLPEYEQR